jgi:DNA-binding response OmpR family regulator
MPMMTTGRNTTALVVDDEEDLVDLMGRVLTSTGMDVICAHGGQDALQHLRRQAYDLVVRRGLGDHPGELSTLAPAHDPHDG